jgi:hypothetical protein
MLHLLGFTIVASAGYIRLGSSAMPRLLRVAAVLALAFVFLVRCAA